MPQLDYIIIFTQIFWLLITFAISYVVLTCFFLPTLIKSFKTRNLFIQFVSNEFDKIQSIFISNQCAIVKILNKSLLTLKQFLYFKLNLFQEKPNNFNLLLNTWLFVYILYLILYCDVSLLNLVNLNSKNHNFMFSK